MHKEESQRDRKKQEQLRAQHPGQQHSREQVVQKYKLSQEIASLFARVVRDGVRSSQNLPLKRILQLSEKELSRLSRLKASDPLSNPGMLDNELTVSLVGMQSRLFLEERMEQGEGSQQSEGKGRGEGEGRQGMIIRRWQQMLGEVDHNEAEIRKFMDSDVLFHQEVDFAACYDFFTSNIQKLKRFAGEKMIASRIRLLQVLVFFLRDAVNRLQPEKSQTTKVEENISDGSIIYNVTTFVDEEEELQSSNPHQSLSYEQVNKYSSYASKILEDKMVELSGVCEQVTQLEVFSRTLQFSQLDDSSKKAFFRVVDVLMSLHHRVAYLSRKKPHLMKQLENAAQKLEHISKHIQQFLGQLEQENPHISPLHFSGVRQKWKSQLSQHFTSLESQLSRLSEIIVNQDMYHTNNFCSLDRFINIVQLFSKVMANDEAALEEWNQLAASLQQDSPVQGFTEDECRLLRILDDCLSLERSRFNVLREEQHDCTNRTNEELEVQVNKLIQDYERLKQENLELANALDLEQRLKDQLLIQVDERDTVIKNLSARKISLEKKLANQENHSAVSVVTKDEEMKRLEHEAQKYLEKSLLLTEQLKVSEAERERLLQSADSERGKYLKAYQSVTRLRPEKDRLDGEIQDLKHQIAQLKAENSHSANRLSKTMADFNNEKSLLEMQLDTEEKNNKRLMERLQLNQKKLAEYGKLMMAQVDQKDQSHLPKLERDNERLKREIQNLHSQLRAQEQQNTTLRDDVATLKFKLKEGQLHRQDPSDLDYTIQELRAKLDKTNSKNAHLSRSIEELKGSEEQLEEKARQGSRRIKELESRERELQNQRSRLSLQVEDGERRHQDMQRQIEQLRNWAERETRTAREALSKRDIDLLDKASLLGSLEMKIKMLEEQLAQRAQHSERTTHDLIDAKVKQYQSSLQTHKLIELKLEEQNNSLKKDLEEKVEVEFKLNTEIDRLAKEIDRMKAELDKYLRELTEKEVLIKLEREKLEDKERQLREVEVREKVLREQGTPHHDKPHPQTNTPSQFDPHDYNAHQYMSRSGMRYDNYYNAQQYDRLLKQYNDFKNSIAKKFQKLEDQRKQLFQNNALLQQQLQTQRPGPGPSSKEGQLQKKITFLEETIRNLNDTVASLEAINRETLQNEAKLRQEMERQSKNMLEHHQLEIKQLMAQSEQENGKLSAEVENLRRQVQATPHSSQLEKEKEERFNQLKKQIQQLINEKKKLAQQNSRILSQRNHLQQEKFTLSHEFNSLKETVVTLEHTIQILQSRTPSEDSARKSEDLAIQLSNLSKERDLIRNQYESMKIHLEQQTKRAITLETQLLQKQKELDQNRRERTSQDRRQGQYTSNSQNIDYLLAKIKALEEALSAVGDELTDSKNTEAESIQVVQSRIISSNDCNELQRHIEEWNKKENVYLRELQTMSREIISLQDALSRNKAERSIVTSLPQGNKPSGSTYKEGTAVGNRAMGHIRVDKFLQGKKRWEKMGFSESLSSWGVPPVVCQEVQDLRLLFLSMSESLLTINQEQIQLQQKISSSPSLSNLLEYSFRILTFFSEVNPNSQEGTRIRSELQNISRQHKGGYFFTVLEQYTIHLLQNNAIEEYKKELRVKAQQLLQIKQKLEEVINRQIQQEENILRRPQPVSSRVREPGHYTSSSLSSLQSSPSHR